MIFGMGMLEMGITFSFSQLILDSAIVADIRDSFAKISLPETFSSSGYLHELVAMYKGELPPAQRKIDRAFWQGAANHGEILQRANAFADEILHSHKVEPLDGPTRRQMQRIILAAEAEGQSHV